PHVNHTTYFSGERRGSVTTYPFCSVVWQRFQAHTVSAEATPGCSNHGETDISISKAALECLCLIGNSVQQKRAARWPFHAGRKQRGEHVIRQRGVRMHHVPQFCAHSV